MRSRKAMINTVVSIGLQIVTALCGLIVPRIIIGTYGSEVTGLTSSITQFLSYITLLEAGVAGVVRAALYKPFADHNSNKISEIIKATEIFFRKIAYIFLVYTVLLACLYPVLVNRHFDWFYTASLTMIIGISSFAQYYFGITYTVLVTADQKRYITYVLQIGAVILNAVLVFVFARLKASIHLLKLGTALVYTIRPLILYIYVRKKYKINRKAKPDNDAIKQRWDGLGHHIAFFVNLNTDIMILTFVSKFSDAFSIAEVAVYSIYYSILNGITNLTNALSTGMEAALGNMIAKKEKENLNNKFSLYEFLSYAVTTILFTVTGLLIMPFMSVYSKGITDADYMRPAFAYLLLAAFAVYTIRYPYNNVALAAGHYKQTRNAAFAEAGINVAISVTLVYFTGLEGVAIGTLAAMTFRTFYYVWYLSKNILYRKVSIFFKRIGVSAVAASASVAVMHFIPRINSDSYFTWFLLAVETVAVVVVVTLTVNFVFSKKELKETINLIKRTLFTKKNQINLF